MDYGVDHRLPQSRVRVGRVVVPALPILRRCGRNQGRGTEVGKCLRNLLRQRPGDASAVNGLAIRRVLPVRGDIDVRPGKELFGALGKQETPK